MPCFTPVEAWQLESGQVVFSERGKIRRSLSLRCGQCVGCRKDRAAEWAARILHEAQLHKHSWFLTLSYDDEHVPADGSLDYKHFQSFMRRLRKWQRRRERKLKISHSKIRFYMAGEYGEEKGRPHYHPCMFGVTFPDQRYYRKSPSGFSLWRSDDLDKLWSHGLCSIGALSFDSAAYTAGYINKKVLGSLERSHYTRVNGSTGECHQVRPEFARMSLRPGIGARWLDQFCSDVLPRDYVVVNGRKSRVPRYYCNLFRERDPLGYAELEADRFQKSLSAEADRTPARLAVRHRVAAAKASLSTRKL